MKVEKEEALKCLELLRYLIEPTIHHVKNDIKDKEFTVEFKRGDPVPYGRWVVPTLASCAAAPTTADDYRRLAAASVFLARFLSSETGR